MKTIWTTFRSTLTNALRDTPLEVLLALATATAISGAVEDLWESDLTVRFALVAVLMVLTLFSASALEVFKVFDRKKRWVVSGVAIAGLAAYGGFVLDLEATTELWRWALLAIAATMGVTLVPVAAQFGGNASASERFYRYNIRLLGRTTVAFTYSFLLFIGLAIGFAAIDGLFDFSFGELYGHLFIWVALTLGSILALGSLNEIRSVGGPLSESSLMWNARLGTFLFLPLVVLYVLIMYAYLGKVALTQELPSNILSPLALGAGILGYFGLFVLYPQARRSAEGPLARVLRGFPAAFIPIVPVGLWAVVERVGQYGWTEFRYVRIAALISLGLFSIHSARAWWKKRDFSLVAAPTIVAGVAVLSAVGPWGASNVSLLSQQARMAEALASGETRVEGSSDRYGAQELSVAGEIADYLTRAHGEDALDPFVAPALIDAAPAEQRASLDLEDAPNAIEHQVYSLWKPHRFSRGGTATDFSLYNDFTERNGFELRRTDDGIAVTFGDKSGNGLLYLDDLRFLDGNELNEEARQVPIFDGVEMIGELSLTSLGVRYLSGGPVLGHATGMVLIYD